MKIRYIAASIFALTACSGGNESQDVTQPVVTPEPMSKVNPSVWPKGKTPIARDAAIESRITELLGRMTIEEKVGQVIQGDIASTTPEDAKKYNLGSVLNGGNSAPNNDNRSPAGEWVKLANAFWQASVDVSDGGVGIPIIWGTDAVHGHNNITGATLFPHNIGLGAANDPELMRKIGRVTAKEIRVTAQEWTFAPTLAVARNDRWGRTYESYSENPDLVAQYAGPLVEGIQGVADSSEFLDENHIISTAKHFIGDGGTHNGKDQGDTLVSESELIEIHGAGYTPAINKGVQVIMASFNAWNGQKMHGYKAMLNDVLVEQMGFDGFVVGDWNGHGQVAGCSNASCPQAINAGLDMYMASDSWKPLYHSLLKQVKSGVVTESRLDQAVSRILRVKMRAGLFSAGKPSTRKHANNLNLLAAPEHRAVAREAVRKSLVLLKNNGVLPLAANIKVLVAGDGAANIGKQSGGWTLNWQGSGLNNSDFPNADSIYAGIAQAVQTAGGSVELKEDGEFTQTPDVAIVVFGENPYAEFQGDRANLDFEPEGGLQLLRELQGKGIKTVSVFLSGRPLWVNPELNASDAFIAAWLPGSEGGGVADVLFGEQYDFSGRLSFSWPKTPEGNELNLGDSDYDPLFAYGFGLSKSDKTHTAKLSEEEVGILASHKNRFIFAGDPVQPWRMVLTDDGGNTQVTTNLQASSNGRINSAAKDYQAQEDVIEVTWSGPAKISIRGVGSDLSEALEKNMSLEFTYKVTQFSGAKSHIRMGCTNGCGEQLELTEVLAQNVGNGWQIQRLSLSCFAKKGADFRDLKVPFEISSEQGTVLQIGDVKLVSAGKGNACF